MSDPAPESDAPPEQGGRYQRSVGGLIGALIVSLLAIAAYVGFRAINRDDLEITPEPVDYLGAVASLREDGVRVWHPASLPEQWICTTAEYVPGPPVRASIGILTDDGKYAGVAQEVDSVEDLVERFVDDKAVEGDPVTLDSPAATQWRTFTDEGGDYALLAKAGESTIIVYGSASQAQLQQLATSLRE